MCGICGIFNLDESTKVDKNVLKTMLGEISYRGPDDEGIYTRNNFGFGNSRLSIIDVEGGHQPIFNEDKSLGIVFNGEIYNFLELKKNLLKKGHHFSNKTDTEVILHLYEDENERCVGKLDGMFAFAVFDFKKNILFLARDRMGKKPIYWTLFNNSFIFASEPKAILKFPRFARDLDEKNLPKYFFYGYVPSPNTLFKNIKKLPAGCYLLVNKKGTSGERKFWQLDYQKKIVDANIKEVKEKTIFLLKKAVEKRLLADVPVGVFLSGGLDSSLVAAFISKKNIQAFTIGFEEEESDESESAKKIAEHLGIKQNLYVFPHREAIALFPKVMSLMDEPMADPSILPTYLLSAFAQKKVKVALSGDGGDETFLGYPKYLAHFWLKKTNLEKINVSLLAKIFSPKINSFLSYSYLPLYLRNQFWLNSLPQDKIEKLTGQRLNLEDLERFHHDFSGKDNLDETFFLDQKLTLAEQFLVKVDRASMFNGLEVRCPFLDKDLVEYSAQIPFELKIKWFKTKSILREIAKDYLPKEITTLPKKGFGVPLKRWLKYDLKDFVGDYLSLKRMKKEGLLNTNIVKGILKENDPFTIWKLLAFEIWVEKWLRN